MGVKENCLPVGACRDDWAACDKMERLRVLQLQDQGSTAGWGGIVGEKPRTVGTRKVFGHTTVGKEPEKHRNRPGAEHFGESKAIAKGTVEGEGMPLDEKKLSTAQPARGRSQRALPA